MSGVNNLLVDTDEGEMLKHLFRDLRGTWKLKRTLESTNASEPAGVCEGVATFQSRPPSRIRSMTDTSMATIQELLYQENGKFQIHKSHPGAPLMPSMTFSRSYIWRMDSSASPSEMPAISLWFTKPGTEDLDYLFHDLSLDTQTVQPWPEEKKAKKTIVRAHGSHLCVKDQYETDYAFTFGLADNEETESDLSLQQWQTVHTVKGPAKDQRIQTSFIRYSGSNVNPTA